MKLSVIIVNYNVKYFLEQCLHSVIKAGQGIDMEVFVVDNNSVDGSAGMVCEKFPEVKIIENSDNKGFSKANNQAIKQSTGEYVLLLNPDTVVEEDTFSRIISFMDSHADACGLGVKMLDGKGHFLPESKRGLPTPAVAFYKVFGLAKLFPKSKIFGKYHLGYLDKDKVHEVEILSGAFMLLRRTALDKAGLLDENFFMYGEDIDISYRITQAGYKNYYFPETRIIHYKGESTKKSSVNYVIVFYNAMIIFARKHFSQKNASSLSFLIKAAIFFRAILAIISRFVKLVFIPLFDAAIIFTGIYFIKNYWESNVIFRDGGSYPIEFIAIAVPVYILVWLFSVYFSGGYDKPVRPIKIIQGVVIGTVLILTVYALLGEQMRFSRALIIFGAGWAALSMVGTRVLLHLLDIKQYKFGSGKNRRFIIIGDDEEAERVAVLLQKTLINYGFIGLVNTNEKYDAAKGFIGNISQLADIIYIYKIDEAVFCSKSMPPQLIIDKMTELQHTNIDYKIAPPESMSIIGSNSINTTGELYVLNVNAIGKISNKRSKRLLDLIISTLLLAFYPILVFFVKQPLGFLKNIFKVLTGIKSWVGFGKSGAGDIHKLPAIRKGVLNPTDAIKKQYISDDIASSLNILYAKDYKIINDLNIILKGFSKLGRK
ncbi:MAG TPA: glycosyltransferase [Bacteroidales bacterium]|nr:glycosyltransferase [Bacteroidales bacterium]